MMGGLIFLQPPIAEQVEAFGKILKMEILKMLPKALVTQAN
jgi:hypothetical protein